MGRHDDPFFPGCFTRGDNDPDGDGLYTNMWWNTYATSSPHLINVQCRQVCKADCSPSPPPALPPVPPAPPPAPCTTSDSVVFDASALGSCAGGNTQCSIATVLDANGQNTNFQTMLDFPRCLANGVACNTATIDDTCIGMCATGCCRPSLGGACGPCNDVPCPACATPAPTAGDPDSCAGGAANALVYSLDGQGWSDVCCRLPDPPALPPPSAPPSAPPPPSATPSAPPPSAPPPFAPEGCATRDAAGMPAKRTVASIRLDPSDAAGISSCLHLTKDDKLQFWDPAQLQLRDALKAACIGDAAVCDAACSKFYLALNAHSRICTATSSGENCQTPKAQAGQGSYKLQSENDVGFCDPPSPPPPSPPPPSPPPPQIPWHDCDGSQATAHGGWTEAECRAWQESVHPNSVYSPNPQVATNEKGVCMEAALSGSTVPEQRAVTRQPMSLASVCNSSGLQCYCIPPPPQRTATERTAAAAAAAAARAAHAAALAAAHAAPAAARPGHDLHEHVRRPGARRLGGLPQPPQLLVRARDRGCRICNKRHLRGWRPGKHGEQ